MYVLEKTRASQNGEYKFYFDRFCGLGIMTVGAPERAKQFEFKGEAARFKQNNPSLKNWKVVPIQKPTA